MTGLKSGSGDDLWGDDGDDTADDSADDGSEGEAGDDRTSDQAPETADGGDSASAAESGSGRGPASAFEFDDETTTPSPGPPSTDADDSSPELGGSSADSGGPSGSQSYIVRRAVRDKSVQFERDERLTFFVHDDVAEGERDLVTELQSALGRDVPKFDVREAVYRAALRNPDDVLDELLEMGYSIDDE